MKENTARAERLLREHNQSIVVIRGEDVFESGENGVRALMKLQSGPKLLEGASVADKVVGKAAAMLMIRGHVAEVYAELLSKAGSEALADAGIPFVYRTYAPMILNRDGSGMCPMEAAVSDISNPEEAYEALRLAIARMQQKAAEEAEKAEKAEKA